MPADANQAEEERRKALIHIREFINATKDCVDTGMYLFASISPHAAVVLGVAYAVKNLISAYGPSESDPIVQELAVLRTKMDAMVDRMTGHFTAFKSFFVENHFYNDVPLTTSVLYECMQDVTSHPTEESLREFRRMYEKTSPLKQARKLIHQLETEVMNPLKTAMHADPLMSSSTFDTWQKIIDSVFTQLWEIEIKAGVLIHGKTPKDVEELFRVRKLKAEIEKYQAALKKWDHDYGISARYWPEKVKNFVVEIQDKHSSESMAEKAELIREGLEKIRTTDMFYVLVFPKSCTFTPHMRLEDQVLISPNRGGSTVIVYRSKKGAFAQEKHMKIVKNHVQFFKDVRTTQKRKVTEDLLKRWTHAAKWPGFVVVVEATSGVAVRSTRTSVQKDGPGFYLRCKLGEIGTFMDCKELPSGKHETRKTPIKLCTSRTCNKKNTPVVQHK
ncbi:unnamed protein product [Caenorhabditis sp. 36 PRJEB53466]|nr:unnamed protein product [Caenorhabditis sp. 36 PRJEB53466]